MASQAKRAKRSSKRNPPSAGTPTARRKSPAGARARRERRRQTLAAALINGKKITQVAKEEGVTRTYASHEANAPETRLLMAELLGIHKVRIAALLDKSLGVIEESLQTTRVFLTKEGKLLESGHDTFAQLTGVKRLIEMVQAARSDVAEAKPQTITWEGFLHLYQEAAKS